MDFKIPTKKQRKLQDAEWKRNERVRLREVRASLAQFTHEGIQNVKEHKSAEAEKKAKQKDRKKKLQQEHNEARRRATEKGQEDIADLDRWLDWTRKKSSEQWEEYQVEQRVKDNEESQRRQQTADSLAEAIRTGKHSKFHVEVARTPQQEALRKDLPIMVKEQDIMEHLIGGGGGGLEDIENIIIVCGETGCGKTTQVPQFLWEAGFGNDKCEYTEGMIGVTQPRRVAAFVMGQRVAAELNVEYGTQVSYQVRHHNNLSEHTKMKFMTEGILLREVQDDFVLRKYSCIVLDEAHERSINTDILVGLLGRIVPLRQQLHDEYVAKRKAGLKMQKVSPLKLIVMSATLRVSDFTENPKLFRNPPPVINVTARQFPVSTHFSRKTETNKANAAIVSKVCKIHERLPPGGILVFCATQRDIEQIAAKLMDYFASTEVAYPPNFEKLKQQRLKRLQQKEEKQKKQKRSGDSSTDDESDDLSMDEYGLTSKDYELNSDDESDKNDKLDITMSDDEYDGAEGAVDLGTMMDDFTSNGNQKMVSDSDGEEDEEEDEEQEAGEDEETSDNEKRVNTSDDTQMNTPEDEAVPHDEEETGEEAPLKKRRIIRKIIKRRKPSTTANTVPTKKRITPSARYAKEEAELNSLLPSHIVRKKGCKKLQLATTETLDQLVDQGSAKPKKNTLHVLQLYSLMPQAKQKRVFETPPAGKRLCVISTNIAETSITIKDVKYVVDSGRVKGKYYNPKTGVVAYKVGWTSKAAADQRTGRAGRVAPGHCYRMYTPAVYGNWMLDHSPPEILNSPIESVVLLMKSMGIENIANFPFPTPPTADAIFSALQQLRRLRALDAKSKITPLGRELVVYPCLPRYALMLHHATQGNVNILPHTLVIVSCLCVLTDMFETVYAPPAVEEENNNPESTEKPDPEDQEDSESEEDGDLVAELNKAKLAAKAKAKHRKELEKQRRLLWQQKSEHVNAIKKKWHHAGSDLLTFLNVTQAYLAAKDRQKFCTDNFLISKNMLEVAKMRDQLAVSLQFVSREKALPEEVEDVKVSEEVNTVQNLYSVSKKLTHEQDAEIRRIICLGLVDQVARKATAAECAARKVEPPKNMKNKIGSTAYFSIATQEIVWVHPNSSTFHTSPAPEWVSYTNLQQTYDPLVYQKKGKKESKIYMKGVTLVVFSHWLDESVWDLA